MKKKTLTAIAFFTVCVIGVSYADFEGTESYNTDIEVGASVVNSGPHSAGNAGIGGASFGSVAVKVDFQGLTLYSRKNNGIYTLGSAPDSVVDTLNFARVGNGDVWFGEWAEDIAGGPDDGKRVVYYARSDDGTIIPSSGKATYSIVGINHYSSDTDNQLSGTFTADFDAKTLNGSISHGILSISIDANIDTSTASFSGTTTSTIGGSLINGTTTGHFSGANGQALAGIAKFSSFRALDIALGGTKN